jgi:hypothetical protein
LNLASAVALEASAGRPSLPRGPAPSFSDQHPEVVRTIRAGQTGSIRPGEWIVEQPSDIHQAANNGSTPVVIYLATLLRRALRRPRPFHSPARAERFRPLRGLAG